MIDIDIDPYPWERRKGEPPRWYARFADYYLPLGDERKLEQAFRNWRADNIASDSKLKLKRPTKAWYDQCDKWGWKERSEAFDKAKRQERLDAEKAEALEWQDKRRQLLVATFAKVATALQTINLDNLTLSTVMQAIKTVLDQNRLEYGLPTEISQIQQVYDIEWRESNEN